MYRRSDRGVRRWMYKRRERLEISQLLCLRNFANQKSFIQEHYFVFMKAKMQNIMGIGLSKLREDLVII